MICLKCGHEFVYGPAGCACTQAARREREIEENKKAGEKLAEIFAAKLVEPPPKPSVKVRATPKEPGESYIKSLVVELDGDDDRDPIERAKDILSTKCAVCCAGLRTDDFNWELV